VLAGNIPSRICVFRKRLGVLTEARSLASQEIPVLVEADIISEPLARWSTGNISDTQSHLSTSVRFDENRTSLSANENRTRTVGMPREGISVALSPPDSKLAASASFDTTL
jgi:hypothetical protein